MFEVKLRVKIFKITILKQMYYVLSLNKYKYFWKKITFRSYLPLCYSINTTRYGRSGRKYAQLTWKDCSDSEHHTWPHGNLACTGVCQGGCAPTRSKVRNRFFDLTASRLRSYDKGRAPLVWSTISLFFPFSVDIFW